MKGSILKANKPLKVQETKSGKLKTRHRAWRRVPTLAVSGSPPGDSEVCDWIPICDKTHWMATTSRSGPVATSATDPAVNRIASNQQYPLTSQETIE